MVSKRSSVRTSASEVKGIKETDLADSELNQSMNLANQLVEEYLTGQGLSTQTLTDIETYLAAHYVSIGRDKSEGKFKAGDLSAGFTIEGGTGLDATPFGQQAKLLDSTGKLAHLDEQTRGGRTPKALTSGDWS